MTLNAVMLCDDRFLSATHCYTVCCMLPFSRIIIIIHDDLLLCNNNNGIVCLLLLRYVTLPKCKHMVVASVSVVRGAMCNARYVSLGACILFVEKIDIGGCGIVHRMTSLVCRLMRHLRML